MAGHQAPQDGTDPELRSRSCVTGAHGDCGHLGFVGSGLRIGGRPPLVLCRCSCHLSCTLAGRLGASHSTWVGLCDCPGTELAEDRIDEAAREVPDLPDMERLLREQQEERARQRQQEQAAREAARAAAQGKSRAQIRETYVAELRARGLTAPSGLVLDATADAIARNRERFSAAYSARIVAELGRDLWKLLSRPGRE
jgi:hypothetical protein